MMQELSYIGQNLAEVRAQITAAERAVGRVGQTRMLAAVKYGNDAELRALLAAGACEIGENRVQQLLDRWELYAKANAKVHFIGSLQTNKVKYIVDKVCMIHSVDSLRLAQEIHKRAAAKGLVIDVLVEINAAQETTKGGALPDQLQALCRDILALSQLRLRGFMTMGPRFDSAAAYRAYFTEVREMGDALWQALQLPGRPLYSMGMSESFTAAIAAGADMVRVGRRLFCGAPEQETTT